MNGLGEAYRRQSRFLILVEFVARRSPPVTVPSVQTTETDDADKRRAFLRRVAAGAKSDRPE